MQKKPKKRALSNPSSTRSAKPSEKTRKKTAKQTRYSIPQEAGRYFVCCPYCSRTLTGKAIAISDGKVYTDGKLCDCGAHLTLTITETVKVHL